MELINWSISAIDKIFSLRKGAPGEPTCPDGTFAAGYVRDAWNNWQVLCLEALSVEDAEDLYMIGLLMAGFLFFGFGIALTYRKIVCDTLGCTSNEVCSFRDAYVCGYMEGQRLHPETFDVMEVCASSTGTISLSRCQLFESDFAPEILHLDDPSCTATVEDGRVLFHFDHEGHICGTTLSSNGTHFIYQNTIHSILPESVITRNKWINIAFSCAYPLIQTLSMPMDIKAEHTVVSIDLPGQGSYQIHMIPYMDAQFTHPYEGDLEVQVNQQMYVAVEVEGVDRSQIATVLDNCWATPVNDSKTHIRWNLIIRECPNPEDGTVEVLQNGIDTTSRFSFRMFTFTGVSDRIFLFTSAWCRMEDVHSHATQERDAEGADLWASITLQ